MAVAVEPRPRLNVCKLKLPTASYLTKTARPATKQESDAKGGRRISALRELKEEASSPAASKQIKLKLALAAEDIT